MSKTDKLNINKVDILASLAKATAGSVPIFGSFISGIIEYIIPNQRIDRIVSYIRKFEQIIVALKVDIEVLNKKLSKPDNPYLILIEDSFIQAAKTVSDDRRVYLANLVVNGLNDEKLDVNRYRYLLSLLSELNDEEIIWLRFYLEPTLGGDKEFREKHINVLERPRTFIGAPEENLNKAALQDSYSEHLDRLGLIESKIQIDKNTNLPIFNKSGKPKVSSRHTTRLGKMLLKEIGLLDEL